jgi:hypothetical protein
MLVDSSQGLLEFAEGIPGIINVAVISHMGANA